MIALKIHEPFEERPYLDQIAAIDLRTPEAVVRWLIREEAQRRGLISSSTNSALASPIDAPEPEPEAAHANAN